MFQCDKCGLCCIGLNRDELTADMHNGDGICKNLDMEHMLCRIYEKRPVFCRVEDFYEQHLADKMEKEEFLRLNYEACEAKKKEWEACGRDIFKMVSVVPELDSETGTILKESLNQVREH